MRGTQDCRERREDTTARHIGLKHGQGAYSDSKTIDDCLERDEEMVEDAPSLFGPMR